MDLSVIPECYLEIETSSEDGTYRIVGPADLIDQVREAGKASGEDGGGLDELTGSMRPPSAITLPAEDWESACIPKEAMSRSYLHPLGLNRSHEIAAGPQDWHDTLAYGAFAYFDASNRLLQVNRLVPMGPQASLHLVGPFAPTEQAVTVLRETERMEPVQIEELIEAGFVYFTWVDRDETFDGAPLSRDDPNEHGSFIFEREGGGNDAVVYPIWDSSRALAEMPKATTNEDSLIVALEEVHKKKQLLHLKRVKKTVSKIIMVTGQTTWGSDENRRRLMIFFLVRALIVFLYFIIGIAFYYNTQNWDGFDCFYFIVVTMSTVGYGDFGVEDQGSRWFTAFFILLGIAVVFVITGSVVEIAMGYLEFWFRRLIRAPMVNDSERLAAMSSFAFYARKLAFYLTFGFLVTQLFFASMLTLADEFDYKTALWHCWVTTTTVGYGDVYLSNRDSRTVASIHILIAVSWLAGLINRFFDLQDQREFHIQRSKLIRAQLSEDLIQKLDKDKSGEVSKVEFVVGMLIAMGAQLCGEHLKWDEHVVTLLERFEALDVDKNGTLDKQDLDFMVQEARKSFRRKHSSNFIDEEASKSDEGSTDESLEGTQRLAEMVTTVGKMAKDKAKSLYAIKPADALVDLEEE